MSSDDEYIDDDLFGEAEPGPSSHQRQPSGGGRSGAGRGGRGRGNPFPDLDDIPAPTGFNALGRGLFPGGFGFGRGAGGFDGGHPLMRPSASSFKKNYIAYSTSILEAKQGRGDRYEGRSNVMYGGKIIMPQEALMDLTNMEMESPYMFEIRNTEKNLFTHCGVLEFIADPGTVHLPQWMMDRLKLSEGDPIRLTGARLPKGRFAKVQAQSALFLEVDEPREVLEQALKNFTTLTVGDIITIYHHMMTFDFLIMELKPEDAPGVNLIDTDLSVDFAPPKDYVEPAPVPRAPPPTMASKMKINTSGTQSVDARGSGTSTPTAGGDPATTDPQQQQPAGFEAFRGGGKTMGGKVVKGKGTSKKKIEDVDPESRIIRTDRARIVTADTQIGDRKVPAKLELPYGTLFFGYNTQPFRQRDPNAPAPATEPAGPFAAVQGEGNTLSGRSRPRPPPTTAGASTPPPVGSPQLTSQQTPFGGQGHSLTGGGSGASGGIGGLKLGGPSSGKNSGRGKKDVIEID